MKNSLIISLNKRFSRKHVALVLQGGRGEVHLDIIMDSLWPHSVTLSLPRIRKRAQGLPFLCTW